MSSKLPWPHCRPHGSHNGPVSSPLPEPVKPAHGRGISNDARVSRVSTLHALSSLAKDASTIPHPRLLLRLIDIAQSIDGPQEIQQVLHQILDIIGPLVFELRTKNIPIHNGTPGAAILLILASNVTAIRDIGNQLSNSRCTTLELHDLYAALSRYRENLTKCVKESKSLMSKHMASIGDQNGGGANPSVTRKDISFVVPPVNIYALLRSTAGQAVFEQMSKASLGRVNEITAKSEFLSQDSSNSPPE
ncbi:hypothetical protein BS47DRAFT_64248 [Hydnum rufescens UP504]|uniref:Uncharacterized protein n=1 Tax=Hydnum rufescens UP504 TaxID=1448309 RepID=A0A9P6ARD5_9AGAM|nr:hypothetical protein BS47DRAFT_64248 [Hydnum rufescens UP504]